MHQQLEKAVWARKIHIRVPCPGHQNNSHQSLYDGWCWDWLSTGFSRKTPYAYGKCLISFNPARNTCDAIQPVVSASQYSVSSGAPIIVATRNGEPLRGIPYPQLLVLLLRINAWSDFRTLLSQDDNDDYPSYPCEYTSWRIEFNSWIGAYSYWAFSAGLWLW